MDELTLKRKTPAVTTTEIKPRKPYAVDGKDRLLLPMTWLLGFLGASLLGAGGLPGFSVTLLTLLWYAALLWYRGRQGLGERASLLLFVSVLLLSLTFSLYSNRWLRGWNLLFLPALMILQFFQWSGQGRSPWTAPTMLPERFCLLLRGLFGRIPACYDTARSYRGDRRVLAALAGLLLAFPVMTAALLLLTDADRFFAQVVEELALTLVLLFGSSALRLLLGLLAVPFLFGLFHFLRYGEKAAERSQPLLRADALAPCMVLLVMDVLYLFFIAVQSAVLFGGPTYLEQVSGLSYAEYARSGFFQLVFVAVLNLTLVLSSLQLARREGGAWKLLRGLAALLVFLSGVILLSAACRMGLYVSVYGLSFKRLLTYWGMGMLALFFLAALRKIWKPDFSFFRVFLVLSISGWLVLNYCGPDRLVTRYNIALYRNDHSACVDLEYLAEDLSYDALELLKELPGDGKTSSGQTLEELLCFRRQQACWDAADWRTWSLSAAWAAKKP